VIRFAGALPFLVHLPVVLWVFEGMLLRGRLLYFRDVGFYYYPNYVFLERALAQGVWPLWLPACDAGIPFLMTDPFDLLLVGALGAEQALRFAPPVHLLIAMCGASFLARTLGQASWGTWAAGAVFGLSGVYLSTVNLFELCHGMSWAPWVIASFLRLLEAPGPRRAALLGTLAAVLVCTLAAEVMLQTALLGLLLVLHLPPRRAYAWVLVAAALAGLLGAPALLGVSGLVEGTARAAGFSPDVSLGWSATPVGLLDMLLPRFFGNVHAFTDEGYWGQPFFPDGYPYLLSLYLGPAVLLLALRGGRGAGRLWLGATLGVLLSMGSHGPLGPLVLSLMHSFRTPVKFLFVTTLALALLAGRGLDRSTRPGAHGSPLALAPGAALLAVGLLMFRNPNLPARLFASLVPEMAGPRALQVAATAWPQDFALSGLCALLVAVCLWTGARLAPLAGLLAVLDLLMVGEGLNPSTNPAFYTLQPQVRALLDKANPLDRFFAYGLANSPGLHANPALARRNSDIGLFYLDRQSLLPRAHLLDGLEGAFDEDRVGWAPAGSTLTPQERNPLRYSMLHSRLRLGGVHFVLSFLPLADERLTLRGTAPLPDLVEPLRLYELRDALPRAFFVAARQVIAPAATQARLQDPSFDPRSVVLLDQEPAGFEAAVPVEDQMGTVDYTRTDPHSVRVRAVTPRGFVIVLDGYDSGWRAECDGHRVPLLRAYGRYWALPTSGGEHVFTLRYAPVWREPALVACAVGLLVALGLTLLEGRSPSRPGA
jgi:hypothetical protein